jgi:hypothetical protein
MPRVRTDAVGAALMMQIRFTAAHGRVHTDPPETSPPSPERPSRGIPTPRAPATGAGEYSAGLTELCACSDLPLTVTVQPCCQSQIPDSPHSRKRLFMLQLARNRKLIAAIVALLVPMSAVGMSPTTARGASEHPPLMAVAVLPDAARPQKEGRYAVVRAIRWRRVRRAHKTTVWSRRRRHSLRWRLRAHEWDARGPPR